jgi:hypothetical protein
MDAPTRGKRYDRVIAGEETVGTTVGMRLRCEQCGSEAIAVKGSDVVPSCCEQEMQVIFAPGAH